MIQHVTAANAASLSEMKIGRNAPCPCGSGKKYKRCHGAIAEGGETRQSPLVMRMPPEVAGKVEELKAQQAQRELQQGRGRPIISTEARDHRVVAVGNRVFFSKGWRTFHDFLFHYIKEAVGREWGAAEQAKPLEQRHPIMQWNAKLGALPRTKPRGEIESGAATGAVSAYLGLAYNLYLLAHNVEIQSRLIQRLKDPDTFWGAYYETFVASVFIKAGFELKFENEDDRTRTHCEFSATFKGTGKRFSVEAKARNFLASAENSAPAGRARLRVWRQVSGALHKLADYTRVVFVDLSSPNALGSADIVQILKAGQRELRASEHQKVQGKPAPSAYVFLTAAPYHFVLDDTQLARAVLAEGFRIPEFKEGAQFPSVRDMAESRERHREMHSLLESLRIHHEIPSTFDGEMPEYAFSKQTPRLLIGHRYIVPSPEGEVEGILEDAVVLEGAAMVWGIYHCPSTGKRIHVKTPISAEELSAYRRHPETFFGRVKKQWNIDGDPLNLFDFLLYGIRDANRDQLLLQIKGSPDLESLRDLPLEDLRKVVAERLTYAVMHKRGK
jgi:hypothetical protein